MVPVLLAGVLGAACSPSASGDDLPTADDARAAMEARLSRGTEDGVELMALEKTDGVAGEVMGMEVYTGQAVEGREEIREFGGSAR